jgi:hypothetical protein
MKKRIMCQILISVFFINSVIGQEKNQALNDYLQTIISSYNQELILIREKVSPNVALELFQGKPYKDSATDEYKREGGVSNLIYNEKDWNEMKEEYYDEKNIEKKYFSKNIFWTSDDFKYQKIYFVPYEDYLDLTINRLEQHLPIIKVFSFSEPMYYCSKKFVVFAVSKGDSESFVNFENYLIIMKKEKSKWIIINKIYPYNVYE